MKTGPCCVIDLFSLYALFTQYRSCDNTLENCFFQITSYLRAYLRIIYKEETGQVPLGPLLEKQNIPAKEVYCEMRISNFSLVNASYISIWVRMRFWRKGGNVY